MPLYRLVLLLLVTALLSGCADDLVSDSPLSTDSPAEMSKVRHAELFDRAPRAVFSEAASAAKNGAPSGGAYVGVIVSLDPYRIVERYGEMDPFRIFERYQDIDRFRIVERYEYEHVFAGASVWVAEEDLTAFIGALEHDAAVRWIEPDAEMSLTPLGVTAHSGGQAETTPWSIVQIGAGTGTAPDVDLYVADTGVSSADLDERGGQDFSEDAGGPYAGGDRDGHGTHIAGIAAAKVDGSGIRGIAAGMGVYDLRVLTGKETADDSPVDLASAIAALEHVTAAKLANPSRPAVLNFSLGTDVGTTAYNALDDAVEAAVAAGVVVVVAAGNSGVDVSTISPAHAAGAITVGAYDQAGAFASFSNHGAGVDLLAPGVDILSTHSDSAPDGGGLSIMSGTSMAAGHVSGAAALVLQANPQATPAQVTAALVGSARPTATGVPAGTTNRTLWVGEDGALDAVIPPLFDYAIFGGRNVEIKGRALVSAPAGNANVFARQLKAGDADSRVRGFGYYTHDVSDEASAVFQPAVNPTGLAPVQRVAPLAFDAAAVSPAALASRATYTTYGDLKASGTVQLGTADAPVVWRVTGNLHVDGDLVVRGYGVLLVEGNVEVKKDIEGVDGAVAVFADGDLKVDASSVELRATLLAHGNVEVKGDAFIEGSITALGDIKVEDDVELVKRPLAEPLARALWGE